MVVLSTIVYSIHDYAIVDSDPDVTWVATATDVVIVLVPNCDERHQKRKTHRGLFF